MSMVFIHNVMRLFQVNLGTIDVNPSSTQGVITIMDTLHQYVPTHGDNILPIPIHGDGLSIERMRDAKAARAASLNAAGRFEGLEPVPQEFHRRVLLMQVCNHTSFCFTPLLCPLGILI